MFLRKMKILFIISVFLFVFPHLFFLVADLDISYNGFVVDENENVYIIKRGELVVYKNNSCLYSIDMSGKGVYRLTVYDNKILIIQSDDKYHFLDKTGKEISITEEEFIDIRDTNTLGLDSASIYTTEKTSYKLEDRYLKTKIVDTADGRVVYEMDNKCFVAKILFYACIIFSAFLIVYIIPKLNKFYLETPPPNTRIKPTFELPW